MRALALVLALLAATPIQRGRELAAAGSWDELYLAFASGDPKARPKAERVELGKLLRQGAEALAKTDPVMAFSLADRSVAFDATAAGLLIQARTALATKQRDAAEQALRQGLSRFPKNGAFGLELGRMLLEDGDAAGADKALRAVPAKSAQASEARALLAKARLGLDEQAKAERELSEIDKRLSAPQPASPSKGGDAPSGRGYESRAGPAGMRERGNDHFTFRYFNNQRDFGQRAEYEGKAVAAMEEAYAFTERILGRARNQKLEIILYTREEFAAHNGQAMARFAAGVYSGGAIRMNDAADLSGRKKATLVHEYVHAVVDELAGNRAGAVPRWLNEGLAEYVEWRYEGSDKPPRGLAIALRDAAIAGNEPKLASIEPLYFSQEYAGLAYATGGIAVKMLLQRRGKEELLQAVADLGRGKGFEAVLKERYGLTPDKLQSELAREMKRD